jgi:uncharacterized protein (DUF2236 family)
VTRSNDDAAGFFGPDSVTWKVDREMVLFLGGPRSLLLQIAHPAVAAAVEEHSDFRVDPLGRLNRTLDAVFAIVFGDRDSAREAAARVVRRHGPVKGVIDETSASPWSGRSYHAQDPELLLWVHATLVDTALLVYERVVGKLERRDAERYYEESCVVGELLGIPRSVLPKTLADFEDYFRSMVEGPTLHVGRIARMQKDVLDGTDIIGPLATLAVLYVIFRVMSATRVRPPYVRFDEAPASFQRLGLDT